MGEPRNCRFCGHVRGWVQSGAFGLRLRLLWMCEGTFKRQGNWRGRHKQCCQSWRWMHGWSGNIHQEYWGDGFLTKMFVFYWSQFTWSNPWWTKWICQWSIIVVFLPSEKDDGPFFLLWRLSWMHACVLRCNDAGCKKIFFFKLKWKENSLLNQLLSQKSDQQVCGSRCITFLCNWFSVKHKMWNWVCLTKWLQIRGEQQLSSELTPRFLQHLWSSY